MMGEVVDVPHPLRCSRTCGVSLIKVVLVALLCVRKLHGHCLRCRCAWAEAALSAGAVS